jgi:hypothetical protein
MGKRAQKSLTFFGRPHSTVGECQFPGGLDFDNFEQRSAQLAPYSYFNLMGSDPPYVTLLHGSAGLRVLGPGNVEHILRSVNGTSRLAGRGCSLPSLYGRQFWLSRPRWEGATPIHKPLRCPPCHSRPTPIAVTTFRSSRIG